MRTALRIRTSLGRAVTRAAVAGALILGVVPALAHAAGPATPLAEPLTEFVSDQATVLDVPPAQLTLPAAEATPPATETAPPVVEAPVVEAPPTAPPEAEPPPPVAETPVPVPPVTEAPVPVPPVTEPPPPVAETPAPVPPVTEATTPPTAPKPTPPITTPPLETAPPGGTATTGPAKPTEIGSSPGGEATAGPLPPLEAAPPAPQVPAVDGGVAATKPGDAKRVDTIKPGAPTELISSATNVLPPLSPVPTVAVRGSTETATGVTTLRTSIRASGDDEVLASPTRTSATSQPSPATPVHATALIRTPIVTDGFRLATPLKPDLRDVGAHPSAESTSIRRANTTAEPRTAVTKDVFSSRLEAPMSAVVGGSSFLAVLASYALPGTGPVPMSLALVMFAQLAIMLSMMRAPRVHLSERLVILGLLAGDAGHSRAVQRPG